MTREIITLALESEGLKAGAQGFSIPEDRDATCLISTVGELFTIARVVAMELRDKVLFLGTAKHERFYFAYESVLGLRLMRPQDKERSAGFAR